MRLDIYETQFGDTRAQCKDCGWNSEVSLPRDNGSTTLWYPRKPLCECPNPTRPHGKEVGS